MRRPRAPLATTLALLASCTGPGAVELPDAGELTDAGVLAPRPLCVEGRSVDGPYPQGPYGFSTGATLPDLTFDAVGPGGATTFSARDVFEPCAGASRLLALRIGAGWCATCRWSAQHLTDPLEPELAARLLWVDVLVRDDDNAPATLASAAAWRDRIGPPGRVVVDPAMTVLPFLAESRQSLPIDVLVDTRTMEIRFVGGELTPDFILRRLRRELADLDGRPRPAPAADELFDGVFNRQQWALLHEMTLPGAPPPDPTNAVADDPRAAALGRTLFFDPALSPTNQVSCATCHDADRQFADGRPTSIAVATGDRNAPSVLLASHARWQFWDGRADTLWAQATGPFENPAEFGSSRLFVAHAVARGHREPFEDLFGALPPVGESARFPPSGKPGDAAWDAMAPADQEAVTRVLANVGKAIAAFERTLRATPNRLDAYLGGDRAALTREEKTSASVFFVAGCAQCHSGPRLTDDAFHNVRFPTGRQDGAADPGRSGGVPALLASPFRADGPFSDAPGTRSHALLGAGAWAEGAFRTPSLRGVAQTAPYGHGGSLATLREVLEVYSDAGLPPADPRAIGATDPWLARFAKGHVADLLPFLALLEAEPEPD